MGAVIDGNASELKTSDNVALVQYQCVPGGTAYGSLVDRWLIWHHVSQSHCKAPAADATVLWQPWYCPESLPQLGSSSPRVVAGIDT